MKSLSKEVIGIIAKRVYNLLIEVILEKRKTEYEKLLAQVPKAEVKKLQKLYDAYGTAKAHLKDKYPDLEFQTQSNNERTEVSIIPALNYQVQKNLDKKYNISYDDIMDDIILENIKGEGIDVDQIVMKLAGEYLKKY